MNRLAAVFPIVFVASCATPSAPVATPAVPAPAVPAMSTEPATGSQATQASEAPAPPPPGTLPAGCPDGRVVAHIWQGEYPGPVVHVQRTTRLLSRRTPCDAPSLPCDVPPGLYHPWAPRAPGLADLAVPAFLTVRAVEVWEATRPQQQEFAGTGAADSTVVPIPAGGRVEVHVYLGEGYCGLRYGERDGTGTCPGMDDGWRRVPPAAAPPPDAQLFAASCGGRVAWITTDEALLRTDGVAEGSVLGYGEVGPASPSGPCAVVPLVGDSPIPLAAARSAIPLPTDGHHRDLVRAALAPAAELSAIWKVDLDGDGTDEVLFGATWPEGDRVVAAVGARIVAKESEGGVATVVLARGAAAPGLPPAASLESLIDLDGGGRWSILAAIHDGGAPRTATYRLVGAAATEVPTPDCAR